MAKQAKSGQRARRSTTVREAFTKAQTLAALADATGLTKKQVSGVLDELGRPPSTSADPPIRADQVDHAPPVASTARRPPHIPTRFLHDCRRTAARNLSVGVLKRCARRSSATHAP